MGKRVLVTGLATFWGGRVAQALEADPDVDVIVGLDTSRAHGRAGAHRVRPQSDESYSILARIVKAARIDTIVHTFLVVDSTQMRIAHDARDQRHRHHEPLRRRIRARVDSAQRRGQVLDPRLRRLAQGSGLVHRGDPPLAPASISASSAASSRSRATCATSPSTTRTSRSRCCASRTCSGPTS